VLGKIKKRGPLEVTWAGPWPIRLKEHAGGKCKISALSCGYVELDLEDVSPDPLGMASFHDPFIKLHDSDVKPTTFADETL
jgi:hypothetical protein